MQIQIIYESLSLVISENIIQTLVVIIGVSLNDSHTIDRAAREYPLTGYMPWYNRKKGGQLVIFLFYLLILLLQHSIVTARCINKNCCVVFKLFMFTIKVSFSLVWNTASVNSLIPSH